MIVRRRSDITGIVHEMDLPVTDEQIAAYQAGRLGMVQDAFPELTPDQREFIMTGITPEEWDQFLGTGGDKE